MKPINLEKLIIGNGAGSIKTLEHVIEACKGPMTRITVGSITAQPRIGNVGETYYFHPTKRWSLNSLGLPNRGMDIYASILLPEMIARAHDAGKDLWVSISPFSPEECGEMADRCLEAGIDGVEINGSCPNVYEEGKRKSIPALDADAAAEMFHTLERYIGGNMDEMSFKLSPTTDSALLQRLAKVFDTYQVSKLVCCNAKADEEGVREDGKPALAFRSSEEDPEVKHKGGLGGTSVGDINFWVAQKMHILIPKAKITGIGGIFDADDVLNYHAIGASSFQSTTGYLEFGNKLFVDMLMQLSEKIPA